MARNNRAIELLGELRLPETGKGLEPMIYCLTQTRRGMRGLTPRTLTRTRTSSQRVSLPRVPHMPQSHYDLISTEIETFQTFGYGTQSTRYSYRILLLNVRNSSPALATLDPRNSPEKGPKSYKNQNLLYVRYHEHLDNDYDCLKPDCGDIILLRYHTLMYGRSYIM
ncbi:Hypothetical predicted protein [Pelobates cultripes]|uniref:Uncharacterized protein n=1 Tax=Pelobates cultripes TaxID=61616 RepID=A0AAD1W1V8_PELCU|nr:Hypothetical predicted protein [Pelobates cultripes]